jgi:GrpB protein
MDEAGELRLRRRVTEPADEPIRIAPYDPEWPAQFNRKRDLVRHAIGIWVLGDIHHVGSTAVPGLDAKPTIDLLAGVENLTCTSSRTTRTVIATSWTFATACARGPRKPTSTQSSSAGWRRDSNTTARAIPPRRPTSSSAPCEKTAERASPAYGARRSTRHSPPSSRRKRRRSWRRLGRPCQNSTVSGRRRRPLQCSGRGTSASGG